MMSFNYGDDTYYSDNVHVGGAATLCLVFNVLIGGGVVFD